MVSSTTRELTFLRVMTTYYIYSAKMELYIYIYLKFSSLYGAILSHNENFVKALEDKTEAVGSMT
jgi:hypothetical protein